MNVKIKRMNIVKIFIKILLFGKKNIKIIIHNQLDLKIKLIILNSFFINSNNKLVPKYNG